MARVTAGISVRVAARANAKMDAKTATRNKLIRLIIMWSIS
jgi:hypothetical protein